jgi:isochorismate synthase
VSTDTASGASVSGVELVARRRPIEGDADLLIRAAGETGTLWLRGEVGFAGHGVALTIDIAGGDGAEAAAAVSQTLGSIAVDPVGPAAGRGPVALGALPFDPTRPGSLVVPEVLFERDAQGRTWVTTVEPPAQDSSRHRDRVEAFLSDGAAARLLPQPTRFEVSSPRAPEDWCDDLVAARDQLRSGTARKVVLARELIIEADQPLSRLAVLHQLRRAYPAAMLFAADGFVGASPELLVERDGQRVRSHPMAGTAPRSGDPAADAALAEALLASAKNQIEHRYTIDMVHETLLPWCSYLDEEAAPSVVAMANVQHLATAVEGQLSSPPASVIELMLALHPTPAVSGSPRAEALDLLATYEGIDRGRYAGPVGWVDAAGNGAWTVGIRSAELDGPRARLFAGVGVVADSDPQAELAETRAKFEALLNAIVRP